VTTNFSVRPNPNLPASGYCGNGQNGERQKSKEKISCRRLTKQAPGRVGGRSAATNEAKEVVMVRVLIERWLAKGEEHLLHEAMRELRREALHVPGYVSGETLRDASDPTHYVVISTWRSIKQWQDWADSEMRKKIEERVRPLLMADERFTVLEPV
jgi:heme-degrading monooxygenase HmoA